MRDTTKIGNLSEIKVITRLLEKDYIISIPFGEGTRYDVIVDDGKNLYKVQIKTGLFKGGSIEFKLFSSPTSGSKSVYYTKEEIDFFGVYCYENDSVYLIPFDKTPKTTMTLRIDKPKNKQIKDINWAKDYLL